MNWKIYFNFILLGLCLTTVLITLITYIIFRIRYSLEKKETSGLTRLEGEFFKRFAPHIEKNNQKKLEKDVKKSPLKFKHKMLYIFSALFILIFLVLGSEHYFVFRSEIDKRVTHADSFRELLDKGLLKSYEFNPNLKNPQKREVITPVAKQQLIDKAQSLSGKIFTLFSNQSNRYNVPEHKESIKKWKEFLKRYKLKYKVVTRLYSAPKNSVWILANYERVFEKEREALLSHLKSGEGVILTGLSGSYNLDTKKNDTAWFEKLVKVKLRSAFKQQQRKSQFVSSGAPLWNVPPGLTLDLEMNRKQLSFLGSDKGALAYEVDYIGNFSTTGVNKNLRFKVFSDEEVESFWSHHDPLTTSVDKDSWIEHYSDSIFLSTLEWISNSTVARLENWKNGAVASAVISIDAEDKFSNLNKLMDISKNNEIPLTVFSVSDLYRENLDSLEDIGPQNEMASHTNDHGLMPDFTLLENFKRLQKSRIDIEQYSGKAVTGFRPPQERLGASGLNAVVQNKFSYIFGDQSFVRYAPVNISNGTVTFFPRIISDDFEIKNNSLLATAEDISKEMYSDFTKVQKFGGGYFFSMHTQIFGTKEYYLDALSQFYKRLKTQDVWLTTFNEMKKWWDKKNSVLVKISTEKNGKSFVEVKNTSKQRIDGLVVSLKKNKAKIMPIKVPSLKPLEVRKIYL